MVRKAKPSPQPALFVQSPGCPALIAEPCTCSMLDMLPCVLCFHLLLGVLGARHCFSPGAHAVKERERKPVPRGLTSQPCILMRRGTGPPRAAC